MMNQTIISALGAFKSKVAVFLIFGQSNAPGNPGEEEPENKYRSPNPNAFIMGNYYGTVDNAIDNFTLLDYDAGSAGNPYNTNTLGKPHGVELYLAYYYQKPIYFIKVGEGGTSLAVDWATSSVLREKVIQRVNEAKAYFAANSIEVDWKSLWNHWEEAATSLTWSTDYFDNYVDMMTEIESRTSIDFKQMMTAVLTQSSAYTSEITNGDLIIQAQIDAMNHYNGILIPTIGIELHDTVHYKQLGYNLLAQNIFPFIK